MVEIIPFPGAKPPADDAQPVDLVEIAHHIRVRLDRMAEGSPGHWQSLAVSMIMAGIAGTPEAWRRILDDLYLSPAEIEVIKQSF